MRELGNLSERLFNGSKFNPWLAHVLNLAGVVFFVSEADDIRSAEIDRHTSLYFALGARTFSELASDGAFDGIDAMTMAKIKSAYIFREQQPLTEYDFPWLE
jgi:hypothetical protein